MTATSFCIVIRKIQHLGYPIKKGTSQVAPLIKNLPASAGEAREIGSILRSLGQEDPLEEGIATHSSILAWRIPWIEEPGRLQAMGSQRVGHY